MRRREVMMIAFFATGHCLLAQQSPTSGAADRLAWWDSGTVHALARTVRDTAFANGLEVISIENHTVPLATIEVVVRTGAYTQDPGTEGVPHLFEHMLFRAYAGVNDASFGESATNLDGIYNGTTQDEQVTYYLTVPSAFIERAVDLMAGLVRDPLFTQPTLDEERRVVLNEFARDQSDPEYRLQRGVEQQLWTSGWGRKNPLGESEAINNATPRLLREIYHRYYVPNNAAVIVSGDVAPAQIFATVQRRFGTWPRGPDPFVGHPIPPTPPLLHSAPVFVEDDVHNVTLRVEWQGPSASDDRANTYAADVLGSVLNAPGSTFQRLLVDSGLFTAVTLSYLTLGHVGPITLYATTAVDSLPHALEALSRELGALDQPDAFNDDELTNSKRTRAVDAAFELDRPTGMAHTVGFWWSVTGLGYYTDYTARMAAVTRAELRRYAHRYICGAPAVVGLLVPRGRTPAAQASVAAFLSALSKPSSAGIPTHP
jgi:zinc protease